MARSKQKMKNAPEPVIEDAEQPDIASGLPPTDANLDALPKQAASPTELTSLLEEATAFLEPQYHTLLPRLSPGVSPAVLVCFSGRAMRRVLGLATHGLPGDELTKDAVETAITRLLQTTFAMCSRGGETPEAELAHQFNDLISHVQSARQGLRTGLKHVPAWEALGVVLELSSAVASWQCGAPEAIKDHAVKAAIGAVRAVLLLFRNSLPQSPEALRLHDRHLIDLAKVMTAVPAVGLRPPVGDVFGELWEVEPRWAREYERHPPESWGSLTPKAQQPNVEIVQSKETKGKGAVSGTGADAEGMPADLTDVSMPDAMRQVDIPPGSFGSVLRELRKARNMTQKQVADAIGLTSNYWTMVENGHRALSFPILKQVCEVLHFPMRRLLVLAAGEPRQEKTAADILITQAQASIRAELTNTSTAE